MTTSPLANPTATRELLEEFGLATKHLSLIHISEPTRP